MYIIDVDSFRQQADNMMIARDYAFIASSFNGRKRSQAMPSAECHFTNDFYWAEGFTMPAIRQISSRARHVILAGRRRHVIISGAV